MAVVHVERFWFVPVPVQTGSGSDRFRSIEQSKERAIASEQWDAGGRLKTDARGRLNRGSGGALAPQDCRGHGGGARRTAQGGGGGGGEGAGVVQLRDDLRPAISGRF